MRREGGWALLRRVLLNRREAEQVAGLAVQHLADRLQVLEADGLGTAFAQRADVAVLDADTAGELREGKTARVEEFFQVDADTGGAADAVLGGRVRDVAGGRLGHVGHGYVSLVIPCPPQYRRAVHRFMVDIAP